MARGGVGYLCYTALVLLGYASGTSATDDLWTIDIDLSPAPPPELGPPFSANATRDPAYLPYQILGIVGSYFIVILFIGTLLLSCGQRARKKAQMMAEADRSTELRTQHKNYFASSPQERSWYSPDRLKSKKSATASVKSLNSAFSPASESVHSFDADVIEQDKQRRAQEMEKLYAAVMIQEDRKSQARSERSVGSPPQYSAARATDAPTLRHLQGYHTPRSPVRAIYPSDGYHHEKSYSNTSSGSLERAPSSTSAASSKKARRSLKNLKISAPIMRGDDNSDGARTPLSPRVYMDPGIPPEPPTARTVDTYDESTWPTTPRSEWERPEEHDTVRDLPNAYAPRAKSKKPNFSQPIRIDVQAASSSSNSLPFRQLHWNSPSSPYYPYQGQGPFSAGPTKTTFVEVKRDRLGAPLTGMATPYSAYMPFTPVTPVTSHLTTKAERRQREREERTLHGAITEEDQVADQKELWGDAY